MGRFSAIVRIVSMVTTVVGGGASPAAATFMASVNNQGSTTLHEITVYPGEEFSVDINISPDAGIGVVSMRLQASASNILDVTDGWYHSPWEGSIPTGGVDPASDPFGASVPIGPPPDSGSPTTLATLNLRIDNPAPPGVHTLNLSDITGSSCPICPDVIDGDPGPDFVVEVLPEPITVWSLAGGVLLVPAGRRTANGGGHVF